MQQLIGFFSFFMSEPSKSQRRSGQKELFWVKETSRKALLTRDGAARWPIKRRNCN